jgi:two-component sensor histidine kinase
MASARLSRKLPSTSSRSLGASADGEHLQLAANRVAAVAQVHRHFAHDISDKASCIDFLRRLCGDLSAILGRPVAVSGDEGNVPTTWIQPIGLLVNELVTNAAKHGAGSINVTYAAGNGLHQLVVCDEGPGLAADFDPDRERESLGMRIIASLVKQLGGTLDAANLPEGNGACFTVTF